MGSGLSLSRSKKVAPVCVVEINVSKRDSGSSEEPIAPPASTGDGRSSTGDGRSSFRRFKFPHFTNGTNFSKVDRGRRDAPRSTEKEDEEDLAKDDNDDNDDDHDHDGNITKTKSGHHHQKKSLVRSSRTYGLCAFKRGGGSGSSRAEVNLTSAPSQAFSEPPPPGRRECARREDVNKKGNSVLGHSFQSLGSSRSCVEQVPKPGNDSSFANCLNTPVTTAVLQYDGSEEELMETIERDFS